MTLPADVRSVRRAREAMREVLTEAGAVDRLDGAELAISELVTNAVVHAGTQIEIRIRAAGTAVRVEIDDGSVRLPVMRAWSATSGTGRGLHIVEKSVDRWNADPGPHGKTVWFEIGSLPTQAGHPAPEGPLDHAAPEDVVQVTLLDVPVLMHRAWQEHASNLLREYLLYALEEDPAVLDDHAAASDALSILDEQLPVPDLPTEPDELMATAVEPDVTADSVVLRVPRASVPHFAVLDDVLSRAVTAANDGQLLVPPTQPEIAEMRAWMCREVVEQATGAATPRPWRVDVGVAATGHQVLARTHADLADPDVPVIVTDERYVVVAVTRPLLRFLGYRDESELVGRRILTIIPARYHQAHIAGTTFHVNNGRSALLDRWITAPVVRADGREVPVDLRVEPRLLDDDRRIFVATVRVS